MASPALARIPIPAVKIRELCRFAAVAAGKKEAWRVDQLRAALGGIANLYGHRALASHQSRFTVETHSGFASDEISRDEIIQEIGCCTGASLEESALLLEGLSAGLSGLFGRHGWHAAEIQGLGVFSSLDPPEGKFLLQYELPLDRFTSASSDGMYTVANGLHASLLARVSNCPADLLDSPLF
jgi:hypothetical protein